MYRGKHDTTLNISRIVSRFPRYISCYIADSRFPLGQGMADLVDEDGHGEDEGGGPDGAVDQDHLPVGRLQHQQ